METQVLVCTLCISLKAVYFFMGNSTFSNNVGSLEAYSSNVTFMGSTQFVNNKPPTTMEGRAITLFQSNLYCNGMLTLIHSEAENGGAVQSFDSSIYVNSKGAVLDCDVTATSI